MVTTTRPLLLIRLWCVLGVLHFSLSKAATPLLRASTADLDHPEGEASAQQQESSPAAAAAASAADDAFTIIFVSDLENLYRGHTPARCRYVLEYIRDLAMQNPNLYFDDDYANVKIDPQLIIHGGDNNSQLGCRTWPWFVCRTVDQEFDLVWKTTFERDLPLISAFGNHDWQTAEGTGDTSSRLWGPVRTRVLRTDVINSRAQEIVAKTYEMSASLGVEYKEFAPMGEIGPSMYRSTFRGVQIANFNIAVNWESYDDGGVYDSERPFNELSQALDREMTTLFFQHYPIGNGQLPSETVEKTVNLIQEFPRAIHLAGHRHVLRTQAFPASEPDHYSFDEWGAPYPHNWEGNKPAFLALLVSPTQGVLQVKKVEVPGLDDGEPCNIFDSCRRCSSGGAYFWYSEFEFRCGGEPRFESGALCTSFWDCNICPTKNAEYQCPWWGLFLFFCNCV